VRRRLGSSIAPRHRPDESAAPAQAKTALSQDPTDANRKDQPVLNSQSPQSFKAAPKSQPGGREQGSTASAARGDPHNPADADFQRGELTAARYLVRRYSLRPSVAKIIAAELRLAPLAGGAP